MEILDSGNRTEFKTGAVRDIQEGKGRCDLLPLDIVLQVLDAPPTVSSPLFYIQLFEKTGSAEYLILAATSFIDFIYTHRNTGILEFAKHLESGAKKYGEYNWQKGIPLSRYVDSGIRHYLKYMRGDVDEPHERAFIWNMCCGAWTCRHLPEMNDYV